MIRTGKDQSTDCNYGSDETRFNWASNVIDVTRCVLLLEKLSRQDGFILSNHKYLVHVVHSYIGTRAQKDIGVRTT